MLRAVRDLKAGRSVDLADFDGVMRAHTEQIRGSMNRLVRYGLHLSSATMSRLFTPMSAAQDKLRDAIGDPVGAEEALRIRIPVAVREVWSIRHELDHDMVEEISGSLGVVITSPPWRRRRNAVPR
ncbi:hypothetical protein ACKI1J_39900 [Streptomyces scabiei]|uniref:hypothetical protein n=1 Tax=Streptomyces scabiei TaxID=1930 RepID=UPI0038F79648